jgi:aryl-alcohol dehydrogenase-like predicted oxidoreductase
MLQEGAVQTRTLGRSELSIVPLIFGGNVFGWTIDKDASFRILDEFIDRGFNCIDTADVYSRWLPGNKGGESESILGEWLQRSGKRERVVLATKVGMDMGEGKKGLSKSYILNEIESSLRRLRTDYIDLYQSHQDDPAVPVCEALEAYDLLISGGKVRVIGASNFTSERLEEALDCAREKNLPGYQVLQPEYNLYSRRQYEAELAPTVEKYGLGVITYFSLASGFLTGKYRKPSDAKGANREARVLKYFDERGQRILAALRNVAAQTGASPASISLAWLLAQPTVTAPIASATSTRQLKDMFAAVELRLSNEQLDLLTKASAY